MYTEKEVTRPAQPERKEMVQDGVVCDICGGELQNVPHLNKVTIEWVSGDHDRRRSGTSSTTEYDLCGNCFVVNIQPALDRVVQSGPRCTDRYWPQ